MTRREHVEHVEDVFAFILAIVLFAVGFAASWSALVAGLIVAVLVVRDLSRKLRGSNNFPALRILPRRLVGETCRPGPYPPERARAAPPA